MSGTADDRYLEWLYGLVAAVRNRNPARSYWKLFKQLYTKEFVWLVSNDDNRVEDGKELRLEFLAEQGSDGVDDQWMNLGCSMLEMLIALARRAADEANMTTADWFWILLSNIGLDEYNDLRHSANSSRLINEIVERVIYRTYNHSGRGGLFPLDHSLNDQRKVELWYQLAEYLQQEEFV